jgi:MFS family permease
MKAAVNFGITANLGQILHQLFQVFLVGMTIGMMRNVVPALAEAEFGVPRGSFLLLVAFVVAFGFVKSALNFLGGHLAESLGRRRVLLAGWLAALPIPLLVYYARSWSWIVAATVLLGVNQGLAWSVTQMAKLDITRPDERGFVIGLNEFAGYLGVAIAGVATGYAATMLGPRAGLLWFGLAVIGLALCMTWLAIAETLPWAHAAAGNVESVSGGPRPCGAAGERKRPSLREVFLLVSWRDRRMAALCQAGLVEKFVDALVWVFWPVYLHSHGASLPAIGWITGVYGFTWGALQFVTGRLSDRLGRHWLNVWGMWICAAGVALLPLGSRPLWWSLSAAITGIGMAMLYPNLSAAVADIAHPGWRASAIGIYRFWRDLGYGVGGIGLGAAAALGGKLETGFWFVACAMVISGVALYIWGEETHPRLKARQ